jgi:hypothetical protein
MATKHDEARHKALFSTPHPRSSPLALGLAAMKTHCTAGRAGSSPRAGVLSMYLRGYREPRSSDASYTAKDRFG